VSAQVELELVAAERVQVALDEKPPEELVVSVTDPAGLDFVPASVSLTVAVQVEPWLIATVPGEQLIAVEVERLLTVNVEPVPSELFPWTLSLGL
jgi:hypothetical protein